MGTARMDIPGKSKADAITYYAMARKRLVKGCVRSGASGCGGGKKKNEGNLT